MTGQSNSEQENPNALEQEIYEISTPGNPRYGQFLTHDEMVTATKASNEALSTVVEWLNLTGATDIETSAGRDKILFTATVEQASSMLNTEFLEYRRNNTKTTKVRTTRVDLPHGVAPYIQSMHPTTFFDSDEGPGPRFLQAGAELADDAPGKQCTWIPKHWPEHLANRYSIPLQSNTERPNPEKTGRFGIVGFNNYSPLFQDVELFKKAAKLPSDVFYGSLEINGKTLPPNQTGVLTQERRQVRRFASC
jgi:hypothetical protein